MTDRQSAPEDKVLEAIMEALANPVPVTVQDQVAFLTSKVFMGLPSTESRSRRGRKPSLTQYTKALRRRHRLLWKIVGLRCIRVGTGTHDRPLIVQLGKRLSATTPRRSLVRAVAEAYAETTGHVWAHGSTVRKILRAVGL